MPKEQINQHATIGDLQDSLSGLAVVIEGRVRSMIGTFNIDPDNLRIHVGWHNDLSQYPVKKTLVATVKISL